MARRTTVITTCDLAHEVEVSAVKTITLSLNGKRRKLDACQDHADEIEQAITPFLEFGAALPGRVDGNTPTWPSVVQQRPRPAATKVVELPTVYSQSAIREWAREQGVQVSGKGQLPRSVRDSYAEAMNKTRTRRSRNG